MAGKHGNLSTFSVQNIFRSEDTAPCLRYVQPLCQNARCRTVLWGLREFGTKTRRFVHVFRSKYFPIRGDSSMPAVRPACLAPIYSCARPHPDQCHMWGHIPIQPHASTCRIELIPTNVICGTHPQIIICEASSQPMSNVGTHPNTAACKYLPNRSHQQGNDCTNFHERGLNLIKTNRKDFS